MSASHIINHASIDIAYGSGVGDASHRSEVETFVTTSLLSVMEEVFDEQRLRDEVLRIDRLELDLGEIRFDDYREQMPGRLREKLRNALDGVKRDRRLQAEQSHHLLSVSDSDRELLYYFLRHGSLPWYRAKCDADALVRILTELIDNDPAALQRFLRQAGSHPNLYSRLLLQFDSSIRHRLIAAFAPTLADRLGHNMRVLQRLLAELGAQGEAGREGALHFYDRVWVALLRAVVEGEAIAVSADVLFERLIKQTLAASSKGFQEILSDATSRQRVERAEDSAVSHSIHQLFSGQKALADAPAQAPWLSPREGEEGASADAIRVHRQLETFLLGAGTDDALWQELFDRHPKRLAEALRHYGKRESVRQHLVAQLDDPNLLQLVTLVEPTEHGFIHAVVTEVGATKPNTAVAITEHTARNEAWEFTLAYLFVERGSRFNKHSYLTSLIKQLANRHNQDLTQAFSQIREQFGGLDIASRFTVPILQTLSDIAQALGIEGAVEVDGDVAPWAPDDEPADAQRTQVGEEASSSVHRDAHSRQLHHQWVAFLKGGALSQLPWSTLHAEQGDMVTAALRRYGQRRAVRRHLVEHFSTEMLQQLVALLQPAEQAFICHTVAEAVRYQRKEDRALTEQGASETVWEFTLAYLLMGQESRFNRRSYLTGLIRKMATSRNVSAAQLLVLLHSNVAQRSDNSRFRQQLLEMLNEIADELDLDVDTIAGQKRLGEAYAHYQILEGLMRGERAGSVRAEQAQLRAVEQLHRHAPWLLVRLFAELQQDGVAYSRFVESADEVLLRRLLESYFQLSHHPQHRENSDFRRAITQHAATVQDGRLFYSYLLGALLNDELIDFDRFNGDATAQPVREHRVDAPSTQHNESIAPSGHEVTGEAQEGLAHQPEDNTVTPEGVAGDEADASREVSHLLNLLNTLRDTRQLVERLEYLLAHYPRQTRGELLNAIRERAMLERLVHRLPERLLAQLLPLISASAPRLYRSAELLTVAANANNIGLQRHDLQRIKWLAIYTYVAQVGSLFDPQALVRAYLEEVIVQAGQRPLQQLGLGVAEALKRQAVPATQRTTYQLLNSLAAVLPEMEVENARRAGAERKKEDGPSRIEEGKVAFPDEIDIENAGLVLATPYLPMLFDRLGLTKERKFNDSASAEFAIHVLQYLVTAELESAEYALVLNKLLCGVEPEQSIPRGISMTDEQCGQVDGLLTAMIQHWTTLGNTSIAGLRETFLNRPGTLRLQDDAWRLKVEERAFDVLLDRIPWSYSTIKYPWMQRVIYVEWR